MVISGIWPFCPFFARFAHLPDYALWGASKTRFLGIRHIFSENQGIGGRGKNQVRILAGRPPRRIPVGQSVTHAVAPTALFVPVTQAVQAEPLVVL